MKVPEKLWLSILGSKVTPIECEEAVSRILHAADRGQGGYVCLSNVHTVTLGRTDRDLLEATNSALFSLADGKPLAWIARLRGYKNPRQVRGADLMRRLCEVAAQNRTPVYLYGGTPAVVGELARVLRGKYKGLLIAGHESPPFRPLTSEEDAAVVMRIQASGAKVVWVGLGAPKQEKWMSQHTQLLAGIMMIGVGAAFDFEAGNIREAPRWVQRLGIEWLHRLAHDPIRLWRRYLKHNFAFVVYSLLESMGFRMGERDA